MFYMLYGLCINIYAFDQTLERVNNVKTAAAITEIQIFGIWEVNERHKASSFSET